MSRSLQLNSDGNDITCMKEFDALKYPCILEGRKHFKIR